LGLKPNGFFEELKTDQGGFAALPGEGYLSARLGSDHLAGEIRQ
jgi:hypothetical protein